MRIIGGSLKGRRFFLSKNTLVRPTKSIVREAIFDVLGDWVSGRDGLELFAGTGGLGIEALSRGARSMIFVERDREACRLLTKNLITFGLEDCTELLQHDAEVAISLLSSQRRKVEILILDPPYQKAPNEIAELFCLCEDLVLPGGIAVLECSEKREISGFSAWDLFFNRKYGDTRLFLYQRKGL
ncbi:MAG: 16S rRNA (guanine(966)-N(2))-methyltransferase RsmD [Candidatus Ratteibacteria bacterium]|jgi:16S rRNA (guanine966-N2)-methyltransferase